MSRTADPARPQELLDSVMRYLLKHGLSELSLRPLAKAVGSSPRVLLYFFGTKEQMIATVLSEIRRRQQKAYCQIKASSFPRAGWAVWQHMSSSESEPAFRLFFEAYSLALRAPQRHGEFLTATIQDWLHFAQGSLLPPGTGRTASESLSTALLAGLRGFMLDYCATHDRRRVDAGVRWWLRSLQTAFLPKQRN